MGDKPDPILAEIEARRQRVIGGGKTYGKTQSAVFINRDAVDVSRLLHDDIPALAHALAAERAAHRELRERLQALSDVANVSSLPHCITYETAGGYCQECWVCALKDLLAAPSSADRKEPAMSDMPKILPPVLPPCDACRGTGRVEVQSEITTYPGRLVRCHACRGQGVGKEPAMATSDGFIAARESAIAKSHGYRIDPAVWDEAFSAAWQSAHRAGKVAGMREAAKVCDSHDYSSTGYAAEKIRDIAEKEENAHS